MLPVRADDILIRASDGLGDNPWDEDVLDEVVRVREAMAVGLGGANVDTNTTMVTEVEVEGMEGVKKQKETTEGVSAGERC